METDKYYLGLDVGGTNLVAGVLDSEYKIIGEFSIPTNPHRSIEDIVSDMANVSAEVVKRCGLSFNNFTSWGIGMPSCVNKNTNLLVHANCFGWKNVPIYDYLNGLLPLPVYIENDANCAALGEAWAGVAKDYKNVLMLTLGTGVGSGIIIDGKIYSGSDNMGAELGHTKLVYNGVMCTCGQKGCMEAYCSSTALIRMAKDAVKKNNNTLILDLCSGDLTKINGKIIFDAAKHNDSVANQVIDEYIGYLAGGISSFITIFRPEIIVLGGGIANCGDFLISPLRERVKACTFGADVIGIPPIEKAHLGNDAGVIGAALLETSLNSK